MNPRKYITDPKILLEEGKAIMTSSDESKFQLRVFAVIMVLSGHSAKEIGEICGYTKAAVTGWVRSVDKHGFESLKMKSSPGRPSRLSDEQMQHIDAVLQSNPNDYGFKVWDGPSLSAYIKKEFNIELAVRQCQRIFHKLGFSLIRPQTFPSKGYEDTEKRKEFKKIDEFKVNSDRVLAFQDEVHFQIQTTITSGWFKKGSNPKVKSFPGRFKASFSGFVISETGESFTSKPDTFNYETTISSIREFLAANPISEGKKYVLVMDNAPWHKKAIRLIATEKLAEYSDVNNKVKFLMLPPYCPDLNPIEQVWRIIRRENTHNRFFPDLKTLESTVEAAFEVWSKPNTQLASLCSF